MSMTRRNTVLFASVLGLAGTASGQITGSFVYPASTLDVFLTDTNGFVNSFGQQSLDQVGSVLNLSGVSVETASATAFRFAGTTTGGVDDPTRASSAESSGAIAIGSSLSLSLFSELRLRDGGDGSIASFIVFDIQIDGGEPAAFSISSPGASFGPLQALTGSILPGDLLTSGTYGVAFNTTTEFAGTWTLSVVPAPGAAMLLGGGLVLGSRRRR